MADGAVILASIERLAGRLDAIQTHIGAEFTGIRQELASTELRASERIQALETDRARWFDTTWPAASSVMVALADRVTTLERSKVTDESVRQLVARVEFLEGWRTKMIGLAAGVAGCVSLIADLVTKLLHH